MSITETIDGTERKTSARCLRTNFANSVGITWHHSTGTEMTPNTERKRNWRNAKVELKWIRTDASYTHQINRQRLIIMLYACHETNKCSNQVQQTNWGLYYRFLTFAWSRASYSQTCSDTKPYGTPAQRNQNAPYSSPKIEEKSSGIRHCLAQNKPAFYYYTNMNTRSPILQGITSAQRHYAILSCSMQAVEQLEAAEKLLAGEQRRWW